MKILFLHGKESKPGGTKANFLKEAGHTVLNPLLPKDDWDESVRIARKLWDEEGPDVVVGSSRGGAVAMSIGMPADKMVLVAPAWRKFCKEEVAVPENTVILHSGDDDVIPYMDSLLIAIKLRTRVVRVGEDHRMNDPEALERLLQEINTKNETPT